MSEEFSNKKSFEMARLIAIVATPPTWSTSPFPWPAINHKRRTYSCWLLASFCWWEKWPAYLYWLLQLSLCVRMVGVEVRLAFPIMFLTTLSTNNWSCLQPKSEQCSFSHHYIWGFQNVLLLAGGTNIGTETQNLQERLNFLKSQYQLKHTA